MMPVNSYNLFYALANQDARGLGRARDLLGRFQLFGFLVYDPVVHNDIARRLERDFDELDRISGGKFLFFAPIEFATGVPEAFAGRVY